jgi:hypothetical protein
MRLGFSLPRHVFLNGKKYRADLSFQKVMRVTALLRDSGISQRARVSAGVRGLLLYADKEVVITLISKMQSTRLQTGLNSI